MQMERGNQTLFATPEIALVWKNIPNGKFLQSEKSFFSFSSFVPDDQIQPRQPIVLSLTEDCGMFGKGIVHLIKAFIRSIYVLCPSHRRRRKKYAVKSCLFFSE